MSARRMYLGDGVYVDVEGGMVKLTTENGVTVTNTIYLEQPVMRSFLDWYEGAARSNADDADGRAR